MEIFVRQSPADPGEWRSAEDVGLMLSGVYDPRQVQGDAFLAENVADGNALVIMTADERETLSVLSITVGSDVVIQIPSGGAKVVIENTAGDAIAEFRGADRSVHLKNAVVVDL